VWGRTRAGARTLTTLDISAQDNEKHFEGCLLKRKKGGVFILLIYSLIIDGTHTT
jgi:hypothetical protein